MRTRSQSTRNSILGKRAHQTVISSPASNIVCEPPTPDQTPNPKRPRVTLTGLDGDGNKENVPPLRGEIANGDSSPSTSRGTSPPLRRTSTELMIPSHSRQAPRRHPSTSNVTETPSTEIAQLTLTTPPPTPPTSLIPIHARARTFLRAICNSTAQITGRDSEREIIREFVTSFIQGGDENMEDGQIPKTLYISGSPGTGKTALVSSVLRDLEHESGHSRLRVVAMNCMALNSVDELWDRLLEELVDTKKRKAREKKSKGLEAVIKVLLKLDCQCILLLDELDHIATSSSSLISLFSLPNKSSSLRIIGIANTHTLTSSLSQFKVNGITGVRTLHFAPYEPGQLLDILQTRLKPLFEGEETTSVDAKKFLPLPTMSLLTKKIAAQTGDVRSLFEVLRCAIDFAVSSSFTSSEESNPLNIPSPVVTPAFILSALKAHIPSSVPARTSSAASSTPLRTSGNSEIISKVQNLNIQARLALLSILLASKRLEAGLLLSSVSSANASPSKSVSRSPIKRTVNSNSMLYSSNTSLGASGIETGALHAYYSTILTRTTNEVFTPISRSEFGDVVGMLEVVGLATLSSSLSSSTGSSPRKRTFGRSASFGGIAKGKGIGDQNVKIAGGVRADEVLRGLGIGEVQAIEAKDIREEEVRAIWERELWRLGRDVKTLEIKGKGKMNKGETFEDAMED